MLTTAGLGHPDTGEAVVDGACRYTLRPPRRSPDRLQAELGRDTLVCRRGSQGRALAPRGLMATIALGGARWGPRLSVVRGH